MFHFVFEITLSAMRANGEGWSIKISRKQWWQPWWLIQIQQEELYSLFARQNLCARLTSPTHPSPPALESQSRSVSSSASLVPFTRKLAWKAEWNSRTSSSSSSYCFQHCHDVYFTCESLTNITFKACSHSFFHHYSSQHSLSLRQTCKLFNFIFSCHVLPSYASCFLALRLGIVKFFLSTRRSRISSQ